MAEIVNETRSHLLSELFAATRRRDKNEIVKILQNNNIDFSAPIIDQHGDTLLHLAFKYAKYELIEILEIFLDRGVDINSKNSSGKTILHMACESMKKSVIEFCIRRNADLNVGDNHGNTAAHSAIENENKSFKWTYSDSIQRYLDRERSSSFINWMVSEGIDFFYKRNQKGLSALYLAIEYRLSHILLTLLKCVTDLPSVEKDQTPLLIFFLQVYGTTAFFIDDRDLTAKRDIVKIILEKSKFISDHTLSPFLRTMISDTRHDSLIVKMIIQHAQTNINLHSRDADSEKMFLETLFNEQLEDHQGQTIAQKFFSRCPTTRLLKLLKDFKVDFNVRDCFGRSFLHLINEYSDDSAIIDFFTEDNCCDVNVIDLMGETPLHVVAKHGNINMAKALIDHGAKVDVKDNNQKTPLHLTVELKLPPLHVLQIVQQLLEAGADVNAKDVGGKTPLHYVWNFPIAQVLLKSGANVDILDVNGYSPLYSILSEFETDVANVLPEMLKYGADVHDPKIVQVLRAHKPRISYSEPHYIKMIDIDEKLKIPFVTDQLTPFTSNFLNEYQKGIELLKNYFIDDGTSIYQLLRKNRNRRCAYLNNEKLKNLVEDAAIEKKFPKYFILILGCYNEAVRRKPLLESATHVLKEIIKIFLPELCIDMILTLLSNSDLMRFIEAFENVNTYRIE